MAGRNTKLAGCHDDCPENPATAVVFDRTSRYRRRNQMNVNQTRKRPEWVNQRIARNYHEQNFTATPENPISYIRQARLMAESDLSDSQRDSLMDCPICCEPMAYVAAGKCKDFVCWMCAAKLRRLQKSRTCPFCKVELEHMLIMKNPFSLEDKSSFAIRRKDTDGVIPVGDEDSCLAERFSHIDLNHDNYSANLRHEESGLLFESEAIQKAFSALFAYICWHPSCTVPHWRSNGKYLSFGSQDDWIAHSDRVHNAVPCPVCLEGRKIFLSEQLMFSPSDLQRHFKLGDRYSNPVIEPHIQCMVCSNKLFDIESYGEHVKQNHISCYICDPVVLESHPPQPAPAFHSLIDLDRHYKKEHFPCPLCQFVAFRSDAELTVHLAQSHAETTTFTSGRHHAGRINVSGLLGARSSTQHEAMQRSSNGGGRASDMRESTYNRGCSERPRQRQAAGRGEFRDRRGRRGDREQIFRDSGQRLTGSSTPIIGPAILRVAPENQERKARNRSAAFWEVPMAEKKIKDTRKLEGLLEEYFRSHKSQQIEADRPFMNELLLIAMTQFFGKDADVEKCKSLSISLANGNITANEFISQVFSILWQKQEQYDENGYDGRKAEPRNWRNWRKNFPRVHPATDVLYLLIVAAEHPRLLRNAVSELIGDLRADMTLKREADSTLSSTSFREKSTQSPLRRRDQFERQVGTEEVRQEFVRSQDQLSFTSNENNTSMAEVQKIQQMRFSQARWQKKSPEKGENHSQAANVKDDDRQVVPDTLPSICRRSLGQRNTISPVRSPQQRQKIHLTGRKVDTSALETSLIKEKSHSRKQSIHDLPILASAELLVSSEVSFLEALKQAICNYIEMEVLPSMSESPESDQKSFLKTSLPRHVIEDLSAATRTHLSLLNGLSADCKAVLSARSAEQILSLRAIYFLLTKQKSDTTSRDWGCRCSHVFQQLTISEIGMLKAYIQVCCDLLPKATLHEEFPALPKPSKEEKRSTGTPGNALSERTSSMKTRKASTASPLQSISTPVSLVPAVYSGRMLGKISSSVLSSETHFPSLGMDGEPAKLTSAEQWTRSTTKNKSSALTHSKCPPLISRPLIAPSPRAISQSSSSAAISSGQAHHVPSASDFPSLDENTKSIPNKPKLNQAIRDLAFSTKKARETQMVDLDDRRVGGVGPLKCSKCEYGNPRTQILCQLCSAPLPCKK